MIRTRPLTADDLPFGLRLSRQAGWNQLPGDWSRLHALQPDGGLVAERDGEPVGTVMTCRFGPVAWVAMLLVEASHRGRGIGRTLMTRAIDDLDRRGVRTIRLDATPAGRPLYESLGFLADTPMTRFRGIPVAPPSASARSVRPYQPDDLDAMIRLDREATGTDRGRLLRRLVAEAEGAALVACRGEVFDGFLLARPGTYARQVGPCIAGPDSGPVLLADAWRDGHGREVIVDIPADHARATAAARSAGLLPERGLLRMRRGGRLEEDSNAIWAGSGPEKG